MVKRVIVIEPYPIEIRAYRYRSWSEEEVYKGSAYSINEAVTRFPYCRYYREGKRLWHVPIKPFNWHWWYPWVPGSKRFRGFCNWYRRPKTTNEKRQWDKEYGRAKRSIRNLPGSWDDINRGALINWKKQSKKKKQWMKN